MVACPQDVIEVDVLQIIVCNMQELITLSACGQCKARLGTCDQKEEKNPAPMGHHNGVTTKVKLAVAGTFNAFTAHNTASIRTML